MRLYVQGSKQEVNLTDRDYIAEGGEAKIYGKHDRIYKLYFSRKRIMPKSKLDELKAIDRDNILRPLSLVLDKNQAPVGISMKWIKSSLPICKLFTNDFRKRFKVTPKNIVNLVENLAQTIKFIHDKNCLIVDGSEMNYLVDNKTFVIAYFIDVDSYQTKHFPATAITSTIKDYHTKGFSEFSDWFSFAVIATQLFLGIHPYKGTHPQYKRNDFEQRMKDNISIFNKDTKLPASVRDFSYIPGNYRDWLIQVLEKGKRLAPPAILGKVVVIMKAPTIKSTDMFKLVFLKDIDSDCRDILLTQRTQTKILVDIKNGRLLLTKEDSTIIKSDISATDKVFINDILFIKNHNLLCEIDVEEISDRLVPLIKSTWNVMPNSTKVFNGIIYQDILGIPYLMVLHKTEYGKTVSCLKSIPELKGYKILEAKHDNRIAMLIGHRGGKYVRFIIKFSKDYKDYEIRTEKDEPYQVPNFVTLDNGIVICITSEDVVEIFSNKLGNNSIKTVTTPPPIKRLEGASTGLTPKHCSPNANSNFTTGEKSCQEKKQFISHQTEFGGSLLAREEIKDKAVNYNMKLSRKGVDVYVTDGGKMFGFSLKK